MSIVPGEKLSILSTCWRTAFFLGVRTAKVSFFSEKQIITLSFTFGVAISSENEGHGYRLILKQMDALFFLQNQQQNKKQEPMGCKNEAPHRSARLKFKRLLACQKL